MMSVCGKQWGMCGKCGGGGGFKKKPPPPPPPYPTKTPIKGKKNFILFLFETIGLWCVWGGGVCLKKPHSPPHRYDSEASPPLSLIKMIIVLSASLFFSNI